MTTKIAKEFKWDMSHRLPFHKGLCKNIHGHTYKMIVEIEGDPDENGMVMDYYQLSSIVMPLVNQFDHSFLCDENDKVMLEFLIANDFRHFIIPETTTAENIAKYILSTIKPKFTAFSNLNRISVRFFETEDVYAEISTELIKN